MSHPVPAHLPRRSVLFGAAAAGLAIPTVLPGLSAHAATTAATAVSRPLRFVLDATVLDGGEQVTSVTLDTSGLTAIDPASLTTETFAVHATSTSPIPLAEGERMFGLYDVDREVVAARFDKRGDIVLDLRTAEGLAGGGTLGYFANRGRNVQLDLEYTITQQAPLRQGDGSPLTFASFRQGRLRDREVDAFSYHVSKSDMKYRLYSPATTSKAKKPLIVWLHGGGEGGSLVDDYYDNETTLRANRGALGFATEEAQRIFGDAYVVAPQAFSFWIEDGDRYAPLIKEIVDEVARRHRVDRDRIYVAGCSNGGFMTLKLTALYKGLFAASVPICGVVQPFGPSGERLVTDRELRGITTPTWLVTSLDDTTVAPEPNTVLASQLIPGAKKTLYENVTWNGYRYSGHWSWIYVARNDPRMGNTSIWQWMARQER
jgi:predicted peptidase